MKQSVKELVRRYPLLYSAIQRFRFAFSPTRLLVQIFKLPVYWHHRQSSNVIARPKDLGFDGGIFNPGALPTKDGGILLLAKGQACHWWDASGINASLYGKGSPVVFILDQSLQVTGSHIVQSLTGFEKNDLVGYEDFRLFRYQGEVWVNHVFFSIVRQHSCAATYGEARQSLSRLDSTYSKLTFHGHPQLDFPTGAVEKNWLYLEQDGDLYLLYSFAPYRVLKLVDPRDLCFSTIINKQLGGRCADIGGFGTMVSFSTNPIEYDEHNWLLLVHQVERSRIERIYHHWGVLVDKKTMLPHKLTVQPLFSGTGARGRKPGIRYVSSVVKRGENFIFFMGEGDAYVTTATLPKDKIEKLWDDSALNLHR